MDLTHEAHAAQPWASARDLEIRSRAITRNALCLRGADRFNGLALAATFALAARQTAIIAGGAQ